jgi:hypothetical protein
VSRGRLGAVGQSKFGTEGRKRAKLEMVGQEKGQGRGKRCGAGREQSASVRTEAGSEGEVFGDEEVDQGGGNVGSASSLQRGSRIPTGTVR